MESSFDCREQAQSRSANISRRQQEFLKSRVIFFISDNKYNTIQSEAHKAQGAHGVKSPVTHRRHRDLISCAALRVRHTAIQTGHFLFTNPHTFKYRDQVRVPTSRHAGPDPFHDLLLIDVKRHPTFQDHCIFCFDPDHTLKCSGLFRCNIESVAIDPEIIITVINDSKAGLIPIAKNTIRCERKIQLILGPNRQIHRIRNCRTCRNNVKRFKIDRSCDRIYQSSISPAALNRMRLCSCSFRIIADIYSGIPAFQFSAFV